MRTKIVAALAALLLIGGAAVAYGQESTDDATTKESGRFGGWLRHNRGEILQSVLADLVTDGVIDQAQSDAIVAALEAKRDEYAAARDLMQSFWEDGVLTSEEIAQLPEPNVFIDPDGPFADALADGELTSDEVDAIRQARREQRQELRDMIEGFLDDDVLTADEIAQLPEPNPFTDPQGDLADALADGQLTREELDALRPHRRGLDGRGGPGPDAVESGFSA